MEDDLDDVSRHAELPELSDQALVQPALGIERAPLENRDRDDDVPVREAGRNGDIGTVMLDQPDGGIVIRYAQGAAQSSPDALNVVMLFTAAGCPARTSTSPISIIQLLFSYSSRTFPPAPPRR